MEPVRLQDVFVSLMRGMQVGHIKEITIRVVNPDPTGEGMMLMATGADGKERNYLLKTSDAPDIETVAYLA